MAACGNSVCGSQNVGTLLRNEKLPFYSELLDSFWLSKSPTSLQGPQSMAKFENVGEGGAARASPFQSLDNEDNAYVDFDGWLGQSGKKRRLTATQVQFLERNFEVENKLEPERKVQLAKELGLQPRQVAIWFQNRRARSRNQRLGKDYDSLKAVYDKLKDDYDKLHKEKQVLQNEVLSLKDKLLLKEKGEENLETFDAVKLLVAEPQKPVTSAETKTLFSSVPVVTCKQEDANSNSAKSDVFDADSPHYTDGNHSSLIDPPDSSHYLLKLEDSCCYDDPPTNSRNFGFSLEDQPFWSWPY
ncbi:homeobox domain-containing protein [Citrus sinensis]|nr:homeobox domain-containing protein [Citrus sinensis]